MNTETLTVSRGDTDKYAERTTESTHTVEGVLAWRHFTSDTDRRESARTTADLYVPTGTDLEARDRIARANGETYAVTGHALWDQPQPQTGRNNGWIVFQVQSTNG